MADTVMSDLIKMHHIYWGKEKKFNSDICSECIKKHYHICPLFFRKHKNIKSCSSFISSEYRSCPPIFMNSGCINSPPYDVNKVANKREKEPMDPRAKQDYIDAVCGDFKIPTINNLWSNHLLLKAVNDLEDKKHPEYRIDECITFTNKDWEEFKNKLGKIGYIEETNAAQDYLDTINSSVKAFKKTPIKTEYKISTPRTRSGEKDFYEQYIKPWYINNVYNKNNFYELHKKQYLNEKEQYVWQKTKEGRSKIKPKIKEIADNVAASLIIKASKNKKEEKNMNKTNSIKIDILKNKINKIKEERQKYIDDIKRIYETDSCLRDSYNGISRKYINYILNQIHPFMSNKKIKKLRSYIILDHLNLKYKTPEYSNSYKNNPLSNKYFNLINAESEDWKTIKHVLDMFKVYAEEYIKLKYEVDLKLISSNESIICERCGTTNILKSNYCNNCGKEL